MGMIGNGIGLIVIDEKGTEANLYFELDNEERVELLAGNNFFENAITKKDLVQQIRLLPFLYYRKTKTLAELIRKEHQGSSQGRIEKFVEENNISAVIVYVDNDKDGSRELSWLLYKTNSANAISGVELMEYCQNNDTPLVLHTRPSKQELLVELKQTALDDSAAIQLEGTHVYLRNNAASDRLEQKLRAYQSICIQDKEVLLHIPDEDMLRVDINGHQTNFNLSKVRQDLDYIWKTMLCTGGFYDYEDWNRKRDKYYDDHGGFAEVRKTVKLSVPQDEGLPYEYDPAECCALLNVRQLSIENSIIQLAQKVDMLIKGCATIAKKAVRSKDGTLKKKKFYSIGHYDLILYPRTTMHIMGRAVLEDTIDMRLL